MPVVTCELRWRACLINQVAARVGGGSGRGGKLNLEFASVRVRDGGCCCCTRLQCRICALHDSCVCPYTSYLLQRGCGDLGYKFGCRSHIHAPTATEGCILRLNAVNLVYISVVVMT